MPGIRRCYLRVHGQQQRPQAQHHDRARAELVCRRDRLAYPVRDGIPVMLEAEARALPVQAD